MRQEFERHRYVNKLPVVDVLLFQSNADYQVRYVGLRWHRDSAKFRIVCWRTLPELPGHLNAWAIEDTY